MAGHKDSSRLKGSGSSGSGMPPEDRFSTSTSGGGRPGHKGWHAFTKLRDAHSSSHLAPPFGSPPQLSSQSFPVLGRADTGQQVVPRRKSMLDSSSVCEIGRGDEASRRSTSSFAVAVKSSDSDMLPQRARAGSNIVGEVHHPCGNERLKRLAQLEVVKSAFPWADSGLLEDILGSCNWKAETAMKCLISMEQEYVSPFSTPAQCGDEECLAVGKGADNDEVDLYKRFRGDALRVSRKQARHARSAMTAFKAGDHDRARLQSRVAREEGQVAAELNAQAAVHILNVRNHHWDNISCSSSSSSSTSSSSSSSSLCTLWELDLHGLHASEAIEAVCNRLSALQSSLVHPHTVTHATAATTTAAAAAATTTTTTTTTTTSATTPPPPPPLGSATRHCTTRSHGETLPPDLCGVKPAGFQGSPKSRSSMASEHPVEKMHASYNANAAAVADARETGACEHIQMPLLSTTSPARKPPSLVTYELHLITGEGRHSRDGAILPSAIMSWLVENKYNVRQIRPGVIAVQPKKKFGGGANKA